MKPLLAFLAGLALGFVAAHRGQPRHDCLGGKEYLRDPFGHRLRCLRQCGHDGRHYATRFTPDADPDAGGRWPEGDDGTQPADPRLTGLVRHG